MKNPELFHRTVGILVKAYLNDTLEYTDCKACAVGNLVAFGLGISLKKVGKSIESSDPEYVGDWLNAMYPGKGISGVRLNMINGNIKTEIDITGYSVYDLANIEKAFHDGVEDMDKPDYNFNGMMSVVNSLQEIHDASTEEANEAKSLFTKELTV